MVHRREEFYTGLCVYGWKRPDSILDLGEVIESDHTAIRVEIEWKGVMGQRKKKKMAQKKRCLNKQKWECLEDG